MTNSIPVTQERLKELLHYDPETGIFTWLFRPGTKYGTAQFNARNAGNRAGTRLNTNGYRQILVDGTFVYEHRLACLYMTGELPADTMDHINGVTDDNRWENLREATNGQNCWNRGLQKNSTTGFKNVYKTQSGRFQVAVSINDKAIYGGTYDTAEEASLRASEMRNELHGEFARHS